ncbi:MAG: phage tail tape measure protein [Clostridia bacterium]|nr:phage tail tape measure protein [Clostridia bacterium]
MADEVASLLVRVTADGSQAIGVLNGVATTVGTLADKNATLLNKVSSVGTLAGTVGKTITKTFGVATVAGLVASAKAAGQLNKELANIGTLSVPTERLKEFKGQIQDIAIATGKNTSDISEGTYQVISAFGDAADTMEKVEINAKAAKAGLATTADSIALTSAVTKAYGDTSASAVQHVADLAFKTVELGQTTFPELAQNMQQVTSLSKQLGVSQEELFASYATLTGVTGNAAEVQTQLKAVYNALLKPSENMEKAIRGLGYESGYTMINTLGLAGTLDSLVKATNGSDEALLSLFNNQRALPAILALTGAQADVFTEKLGKMKEASGAATKAFEVQTEGVAKTGFTLEQAKVKMQVAAQRFGESAAPLIGDAADIIDRASSALANLSDEQRKSIINTGVNITKTGLALAVGGKAVTVGTQLIGTAKAIGGALATISPVAGLVTAGVAGVTAAIVLGSKAYADYQYEQAHFADGAAEAVSALKAQKSALDEVNNYSDEFKELQLKLNSEGISEAEKSQIVSRMQEIAKWFKENYEVELKVESGSVEAASENVDKLNNVLSHVKIDTEIKGNNTLSELMKGYENFEKAPDDRDWNLEQAKKWEADAERMLSAQMKVEDIASQVRLIKSDALKSESEKLNELKKYEREYQNILEELYPNGGEDYNNLLAGFSHIDTNNPFEQRYKDFAKQAQEHTANAELAQQQMERFTQSAKEYIAQQNEMLSADVSNGDDYSERIKRIGYAAQMAKLPLSEVAAQTAAAQNGFKTFADAAAAGGTALNNTVLSAVHNMVQWGESTQEAAVAGALLKNGFTDIQAAIDAGKIGKISEQANELAHIMELIPNDKHIAINADGDISILEDVQAAAMNVMNNADISIQVSANGDVTVLDTVDEKLKTLIDNNQVTITFNVDTGGFDISDLQGNKLGEITADGKINWTKGEVEKPEGEKVDGTIDYKLGEVEKPENATATGTINYVVGKVEKPDGLAKGTSNWGGGNALVNDDGSSDPRELIMHDGMAYMYNEPNVITNIPKNATVLTSSQTKAKLREMGIESYASGKNNSDAFTAARDDWTHYTKTHAVTTAQELQKYLEFQEQFKDNEKDIWDIEEQIFSLMQKQTKELGDQSKAYIEERAALNDWEEVGDSPLEAFGRIKDRNYQDLQDAKITWDDYVKNVSDAGKTLYEAMLDQSDTWLEDQRKYHNMSVDDYIAGINREQQRLEEFYAADMLNYKEYVEYRRDLANKEADAIAEKNADEYAAWQKDADTWEEMRSTYGDWDKYGDSEEDFHKRKIERVKKFYEAGTISFEQFIDDTNRYSMDLYKVQEGTIDDLLQKQSDYISDLREQFSKQEQALRDSWDVEDRAVDMADVQNQLDIYKGAVTDRGQQKYKELQEQMKQLRRDEELYQLQVANNATIESLEAEYKQMEDSKANILEGLRTANVNISAYVNSISDSLSQTGGRVESLLGQLLTAFNGFQINAPSTTYADNRTVNVSGLSLSEFAGRYMGGLKI